ncbi:hypothetical protein FOA52_008071 [Chlamydomonas sp. UWO 241]|nr:hypothetical protein FOA52_013274 [Chlamydomonas sp. UWO 241]KAG1680739.1 hypothetical protein FOA52_008071 [Chlamydomonas sp. UWO 241]
MSTSKPDIGAYAVPDHEAAAALVHKINGDVTGPAVHVYKCRYADQELRIMWQIHDESEAGMTIVCSDGSMEGGKHVDEYELRQELMCTARESRVHLVPGHAKASLHRAIARSPKLAALMGKEECAALVTTKDKALADMVQRGLPLATRVPPPIPRASRKNAFAKLETLHAATFVPLGEWLGARAEDFGRATVEAIRRDSGGEA